MVTFIKLSFVVLSLAALANGFTSFTQFDPVKSVLQVQSRELESPYAGKDFESPSDPELEPAETLAPLKPDIYSFHIHSDIRYRYCRTNIVSRVANPNSHNSTEVKFQVILPDSAFISKFFMEIDGKTYEAYVKEKEKAKQVYTEAKQRGQTAGLVEINARDSNVFNVNVNVKAKSKITFNLTYEELLIRKFGHYEHAISVNSEEISRIRDYTISVSILESQNISLLRVPRLVSDLEQITDTTETNTDVHIERPTGKSVNITWTPSELDKIRSIQRKFVVQYDIDRNSDAGEILLMNGYFVHFFTPRNVLALRKHVVFALDLSGSMDGRKIVQLKAAMLFILDDLKPDDYFNILTFATDVNVWSIGGNQTSKGKRHPLIANEYNVQKARQFVTNLRPWGLTNIHDALKESLVICQAVKAEPDIFNKDVLNEDVNEVQKLPPNVESTIIFLTDGLPNVGVSDPERILTSIKQANADLSVPIFTLAFGESANFNFVKKLALQNKGFGRKIYEASDADLQLKGFYKEISSPLLSNITFRYTSDNYTVTKLTTNKFANMFGGSEIAIAGKFRPKVQEISTTTSMTTTVPSVTPETDDDVSPIVSDQLGYLFMPIIAVDVGANGRDGLVSYDHNDIIENDISIVPLQIPTVSPTSDDDGSTNTNNVTSDYSAHQTEDIFLERLWAYLTIIQLIDKSLADEVEDAGRRDGEIDSGAGDLSEESPVESREEPKLKALRLALKYGFVTPLTSLIVVKPNDTVDNWARREIDESSNLVRPIPPSITITTTPAPTSSITSGIGGPFNTRPSGGGGSGGSIRFGGGTVGNRYGGGGGGGGVVMNRYGGGGGGGGVVRNRYGGGGGVVRNRYGGGGGFFRSSGSVVSTSSPAVTNSPVVSSNGVTPPGDRFLSSQSGTADVFQQMIERMKKEHEDRSRSFMVPMRSATLEKERSRQESINQRQDLNIQREHERQMQRQREMDIQRMIERRRHQSAGVAPTASSFDSAATKELLKISWYWRGRDDIYVNGTKFTIAQTDNVCPSCSSYECNVKNSTQTGNDINGECKHLKDCAMDEFSKDISVYTQTYFCPMRSPHGWIKYAGVCCSIKFQ